MYTFSRLLRSFELPLVFRLRGTVILYIWWQLALVGIYTTSLVVVHNYTDYIRLQFPYVLISVLSGVIGLLLVFRNNTAYDRYYEGRRIWSNMKHNIRALTRCVWVMVRESENRKQDLVEKVSALNLLIAFPYATKNFLREEYSHSESSISHLLKNIPRFSKVNSVANGVIRDSPMSGNDSCSESTCDQWNNYTPNRYKAHEVFVPTNIPLELSYCFASYIKSILQRGLVDNSSLSIMNNALNNLVACLEGFDRILRTPIPLAYTVHLHHATWIYLMILPFMLIGPLNWYAIPAVLITAFVVLGILRIGKEIENPFGLDDNDLPLDDSCKVIHKEILRIISQPQYEAEEWLFSRENRPLIPESSLTALELMKLDEVQIRKSLANVAAMKFAKY